MNPLCPLPTHAQAHGLHGFNGMLTHQDEGTWAAARRAITPAFTLSQVK
jgi:hypothetical protein